MKLHPSRQCARRRWYDLTGRWGFAYDDGDVGVARGWCETAEPYRRTIVVPYPPESRLSGIGDHSEHPVAWYRRSFVLRDVPGFDGAARLLLHFGAVDYAASVWLNGVLLERQEGGHSSFSVDLTDALREGDAQVLVVRAEDQPRDLSQPPEARDGEGARDHHAPGAGRRERSRVTRMTVAGIVLAAGRGARFGGAKLLASLAGRPLLEHVLLTAREARLRPIVVVLGWDAERLEREIAWRDEVRVRNADPGAGISGSVRLGLAALEEAAPGCERAVVLLGDQPRLRADQLRVLLDQPADAARPIVVPRYADGPGNPVVLERPAWRLAATLHGDRGMAQLFAERPALVRYVEVPGTNPDVDTPEDLAALG